MPRPQRRATVTRGAERTRGNSDENARREYLASIVRCLASPGLRRTCGRHGLVMPSRALTDEPTQGTGWAKATLRSVAVQDWFVFTYALILNLAVAAAPAGVVHDRCAVRVGALLALCVFTLVTVRGRLLPGNVLPALIYRV